MASNKLPEYEHLILERDESIVWMTLNRPERLNAISRDLLDEIMSAFTFLADDEARVAVLRGAGRCFSSGFDVSKAAPSVAHEPEIIEDFVRLRAQVNKFLAIWDFPKPVIAAVHGYCLGASNILPSVCDITIVADDAIIGFPALPLGGGYISPFWVPLVGVKRAKQMSFEPDSRISGVTASEWGWANYSVPADELMDTVRAHALRIAKVPADVLAMKKMALNRVADLNGFRNTVVLGAETDALLHAIPPVEEIRATVVEHGIKGAIRKFKDGT
jgi:enoyl-CoA hydratase